MGFNTGSVGVMVIGGGRTQATPTAAALESVSTVIGWKMAQHLADPAGTVAFTSEVPPSTRPVSCSTCPEWSATVTSA